jgi:hypothetical protein
MEVEHDKTNPVAGVDALVDPSPLTISRVALLSRVNSPVLFGHAEDMDRCLEALYLTSAPIAEAVKSAKAGTSKDDAVVWSESALAKPGAYTEKMVALLDAITAFWKMLPNGNPQKKTPSGTETDGSRNSSNGDAGLTDGASPT